MRIKSLQLTIIILILIFGSVAVTSALGIWKTTNDKVPMTYKEGTFAGQYNPADIRGSYTFDDIFNNFKVPIEDLGKAFGVRDPSKYANFQCKELETLYAGLAAEGKEVGTGSVRYFVALYKGLPITGAEETYLPKTAVEILKVKANLTAEQVEIIEKYSVELPNVTTSSSSSPAFEKTSEVGAEKTIKGITTFKDLLDWGLPKEDIEKAINDKLPDSEKTIKDYAGAKGIEFSTIKGALEKLLDEKKISRQ